MVNILLKSSQARKRPPSYLLPSLHTSSHFELDMGAGRGERSGCGGGGGDADDRGVDVTTEQ